MNEELGSFQSFVAERPPEAWAIPELAKALSTDINYVGISGLERYRKSYYRYAVSMALLYIVCTR